MGKGGRKITAKTGQGRKAKKESGYAEDDCTVKTKPTVKYRYPIPVNAHQSVLVLRYACIALRFSNRVCRTSATRAFLMPYSRCDAFET